MSKYLSIRKWAEKNGYPHTYNEKKMPYGIPQKRFTITINDSLFFVIEKKKSTVPKKHPHGRIGERGGLYLGINESAATRYQHSQALAILIMEREINERLNE